MLLSSSLPPPTVLAPECLAHGRCSPNTCVLLEKAPGLVGRESEALAGKRRQEIRMAWLEHPGRVGLELCTGKPTVSSEGAGGFWEEGGGGASNVSWQSGTWKCDKQQREGRALFFL